MAASRVMKCEPALHASTHKDIDARYKYASWLVALETALQPGAEMI